MKRVSAMMIRDAIAGIIPLTAMRICEGRPPEIHGDGRQTRDFIFVEDTIDAVIKLHDVLSAGETVNISTSNQISIEALVKCICAMLDYSGDILRKAPRASDVLSQLASNDNVRRLIDYRLTPFEPALAATLDCYREVASRGAVPNMSAAG